jgi:hypothetical protein
MRGGAAGSSDEDTAVSFAIISQAGEFLGKFGVFLGFDLAIDGIGGLAHGPRVAAMGKFVAAGGTGTTEIGRIFRAAVEAILGPDGRTDELVDLPPNAAKEPNHGGFGVGPRGAIGAPPRGRARWRIDHYVWIIYN